MEIEQDCASSRHKTGALAAATAAGRTDLWGNRDFLKFWAGETVSLFGSQVTAMALPLAAVLALGATPAQMGVLSAARFMPFLLLTLPAGVWVDRVRRRPLLIAANLGRGAVISLAPLVGWLGHLQMTHLYAAALLLGSFTVFFDLAYQSFLPTLVTRERLLEGNSKLMVSASAAELGGPGLAGLLVQAVGAPLALAADALSFFVSVLSLMAIRRAEPMQGADGPTPVAHGGSAGEKAAPRERDVPPVRLWADIAGGLRMTFANPYLRAIASEAATYNPFGTMVETLTALYAIRNLGLNPGLLGLALTLGSVGSLLGSLLAGRAATRWGLGPTIIASMLLASTMPLLIPLAAGPRAAVMAFLVTSFFFGGIGLAASNVHVGSLRLAVTPDHLLGRINASYRFFIYAGIPLGGLLGGLLGQFLGPRIGLAIGAFALALAPLWVLFSPVSGLRDLPNGQVWKVHEVARK